MGVRIERSTPGDVIVEFYRSRNPADPDWLADTAMFHGHLGPWLVVGALIGRDAIRRLETPGHWKIDVTCWMPLDKQRTPFSCMLDGLQASSGATLGKCNIRFAYSCDVLASGWPVVHVVRRQDGDRPMEGVHYRATEHLHRFFEGFDPARLEELSRQLAQDDVTRLFDVRAMTDAELSLHRSACTV